MNYLSAGLQAREQLIQYMQTVNLATVDWLAWLVIMAVFALAGYVVTGRMDKQDMQRRYPMGTLERWYRSLTGKRTRKR